MPNRRHVFISHHHADDDHVSKLTELLAGQGFEIRNSSIRAKPANQQRLDKGLSKEGSLPAKVDLAAIMLSTPAPSRGFTDHAQRPSRESRRPRPA
jgi:hypothetical protein